MIGLDKHIEEIRQTLESNLYKNQTNKRFYGRVFANKENGLTVAEAFKKGIEYDEVMFDNKSTVLSWFLPIGNATGSMGAMSQDVNIFFAVNLAKCYPNITTYRAVSECQADIYKVLEIDEDAAFTVKEILTGESAYENLELREDIRPDLQPFHVLCFKSQINYNQINC